jgi:mono/diheme cytochrome c family protein
MSNATKRMNNTLRTVLAGLLTAAAAGPLLSANAQQTGDPLTGDANRGRALFTTTYKCYACHGYDAQTGERRLLPMNYTQEGFTTFVQRSPLPQMPAYPDMSAQALADVYAYIKSMPIDAPDVEDVPLLRDVLDLKVDALST